MSREAVDPSRRWTCDNKSCGKETIVANGEMPRGWVNISLTMDGDGFSTNVGGFFGVGFHHSQDADACSMPCAVLLINQFFGRRYQELYGSILPGGEGS